jgi:hypothetical protein
MTYKNHRNVLIKQMHLYLLYMLESRDPDDIRKIDEELHRLKNEIAAIEGMTESQQHEQRKTIAVTIESKLKFITKSETNEYSR